MSEVNHLAKIWSILDDTKACNFADLVYLEYALLDYVRKDAFSGVMDVISISKLFLIVNGLLNSKATGLFGIPNEL
ncbi:hypothetical protein G9A89_006232 [Geosiphon pyriformis]|nr:hypothetical protein G9A89_006232 [Geosiphon pyriformis]